MSDLRKLKTSACDIAESLTEQLVEVSRELHANPELAFEEFKSSALLASRAERAGMKVERGAFGLPTAFSAEFGHDSNGPCVGIISEYDALPGIGHARGHNLIAAIGLGTALTLHKMQDELPGRVRYLGTPAEERGCGKELMARKGAFDGVDAAMMLHPFSINAKAIQTICVGEARIRYVGQPGHTLLGMETSRNALDAVVLSYQAIANLRQHLKRGETVTGVITSGGYVPNVFPVETTAYYFVRAANPADLIVLKRRVEACFHAGGEATGCRTEVSWSDADYQNMKVNLPLADAYEANATELGQKFVDYLQLPHAGADMANVSQRVPALHPLIACIPPEAILHTPDFAAHAGSARGESAIIDGAKALTMTAIDFLVDADLRARVRAAMSA